MGRNFKKLIKYFSFVFIFVFILAVFSPLSFALSNKENNNGAYYYGPSLNGTYINELSKNTMISFSIFFPPKNYSYLLFLSQEVANKQMKPLNRSEIMKMFAPSSQEFNEVIDFLKSQGFMITYQSPDRLSIMVEGPAYLVEKLFGTDFGLYRSYNGIIYYAPNSSPKIPSILSNTLIFGLNNFSQFKP
ncbi:MAG: protease pro-enzyme activation domain-containing protein, partial [Caldisphaera sp.]|uniref:protease pro-enzyme activation domain-containing protein n=1 Tax=Caldisphaera sp. TaxID=2060322 RepID=UPI003D09F74E